MMSWHYIGVRSGPDIGTVRSSRTYRDAFPASKRWTVCIPCGGPRSCGGLDVSSRKKIL